MQLSEKHIANTALDTVEWNGCLVPFPVIPSIPTRPLRLLLPWVEGAGNDPSWISSSSSVGELGAEPEEPAWDWTDKCCRSEYKDRKRYFLHEKNSASLLRCKHLIQNSRQFIQIVSTMVFSDIPQSKKNTGFNQNCHASQLPSKLYLFCSKDTIRNQEIGGIISRIA